MRPTKVQVGMFVLILLGLFFRLYNLDRKEFWDDEAMGVEAMSDFPPLANVKANGSIAYWMALGPDHYETPIKASDIALYQTPATKYDLAWMWHRIATLWPEHHSVVYCLCFLCLKVLGRTDIFTLRLVPALLSLLQIPCCYLLCCELFSTIPLAALVTCTLVALSPTLIYYAQEFRSYSLFCAEVFLCGWILLVALRTDKLLWWFLFFLSVLLSFYSFVLTVVACLSFVIYVLLTKGWKSKSFAKTLVSIGLAFALFVPSVLDVLNDWSRWTQQSNWIRTTPPNRDIVSSQIGHLMHALIDFDSNTVLMCLEPFILLLVGFSLYILLKTANKNTRIFVLSIILGCPLAWIIPDLVFGGQRSIIIRYSLQEELGTLLLIGYALALKMSTGSRNFQRFWTGVAFLVFTLEALSSGLMSQAVTWRDKWVDYPPHSMLPVAATLNKESPPPLLVADWSKSITPPDQELLGLYWYLKPDIRLLLVNGPDQAVERLPAGTNRFYLYNPSPQTTAALAARGYRISPVEGDYLWLATCAEETPTRASPHDQQ